MTNTLPNLLSRSFADKTIVVTGATSGIGLALSEALVAHDVHVIAVGRSAARVREAAQRLGMSHPGARTTWCTADLALQSDVRGLAAEIREILDTRGRTGLDGLVNNAGTFTYWLALTPEGFETQWAVNHLAPFLLTRELLPMLQAAPQARVVTLSSGSHHNTNLNWTDIQLRRRYNGLAAYKQTKLANVLFTAELNRRLGARSSVRALAADPGLVNTGIGLKGTPGFVHWIWDWRRARGISPEQAARGLMALLDEESLQESSSIYWKHGRPSQASRQALDPTSAQRLWQLSAQMCGIPEWHDSGSEHWVGQVEGGRGVC